MTRALAGLRVVDLSNTLSGIQTSQIFADHGASVLHVEPPGGSPLRRERAWPFWARGSQSAELDLGEERDRAEAVRLLAGADVAIETFRPGVAARLGLDYADIAGRNPGLVYGSITGFGPDPAGPCADLQGYEAIVLAKVGALWSVTDMIDRDGPAFISAPYCSFPASQLLAQGIFAALYERERSGRGQRVETSLLRGLTVHDTFSWFSRVLASRYPDSFRQVPLSVKGIPSGGLSFRLLIALTADGHWLQFSQTVERLFRAMMRAFELEWMFDDARFASAPDFEDLEVRVDFWERLLRAVRERSADEWMEIFDAEPDVWGERFRKQAEVLEHPQMLWNRSVIEIADRALGPVRQPGALIQLGPEPPSLDRSAPDLGEHDRELWSEAPSRALADSPPPTTRPPLEGITCLELGTYYAAPFGATLLAELGARVIKIEELTGDPMRNMLPVPEIAGIKALQGKESFAVDIRSERGHELVLELARDADVVLQSFRAGVAERLGLDAAALRAVNPELVYVYAPGYGTGGPCGHRPAYAPTIGAGAGLAWRNAGAAIPACDDLCLEETKSAALRLAVAVMGVGNSDGLASVSVGTALTLGLLARARGVPERELYTSMLNTNAHALSDVTYAGPPDAPRADAALLGFGARYRLYEANDDWVFLAAPPDGVGERREHNWERLCDGLRAHLDLAGDARFASEALRAEHDEELAETLSRILRQRSAADWERELQAAGVACVVATHPPVESHYHDVGSLGDRCGLVTTAKHPTLDEHRRLAPLVSFSRSETHAGGGCLTGDHTDRVLRELGYDDSAIRDLEVEEIVARR